MVEIQNNVDFWTNDHLEISLLAETQHLVLRMERTIAVHYPWVLFTARYDGAASQACLLRPMDSQQSRKKLISLIDTHGQEVE